MNAPTPQDNITDTLNECLKTQRSAFNAEGAVSLATRIDRIDRCIGILVDNKNEISDAVDQDFGCRSPYFTQMSDILTSINTLKFVKKHIRKWMKPERRSAPFPMNLFGARAQIQYQPKGVVGIMTPWNFPVNMIFSPLADVLGAGNRAMVKPSEFTPATSELMKNLFSQHFDNAEIAVVTGGPEIGAVFSGLKFDHLIFTGATGVGRLVLRAASENLVPVTLELGGKSPVIVGRKTDVSKAAREIITGKSMNSGQVCISPDYCFVPRQSVDQFIRSCHQAIKDLYPTIQDNPDFVSCINERHFHRVSAYIQEAQEAGVRVEALAPDSEDWSSVAKHKIPLHLVVDPSDEHACMQEEIFGSLLNLKTYETLDEVIRYINSGERPLALYYYGNDKQEESRILDETISGGMSVNAIAMHYACDDIPFGGIGASGMGNYHGREGFRTFSHARGIYRQGKLDLMKLAGFAPPYGDRIAKVLDQQIKR